MFPHRLSIATKSPPTNHKHRLICCSTTWLAPKLCLSSEIIFCRLQSNIALHSVQVFPASSLIFPDVISQITVTNFYKLLPVSSSCVLEGEKGRHPHLLMTVGRDQRLCGHCIRPQDTITSMLVTTGLVRIKSALCACGCI